MRTALLTLGLSISGTAGSAAAAVTTGDPWWWWAIGLLSALAAICVDTLIDLKVREAMERPSGVILPPVMSEEEAEAIKREWLRKYGPS